jgi:hypothetical protein
LGNSGLSFIHNCNNRASFWDQGAQLRIGYTIQTLQCLNESVKINT